MIEIAVRDRLALPRRDDKPRARGRTMVIDPGLPTRVFEDLIDSHGELVDAVKFGWGTCLVTKDIKTKVDMCRAADVDAYVGGTLFEAFAVRDALDEWARWCRAAGLRTVEISNGTVPMSAERKAEHIRRVAGEFAVVSEVGFKDASRALPADEWIAAIQHDFDAGACEVTLEARESGTSGIADPDGRPRVDLLADIVASGVEVDRLLFEAPTKPLQLHLLRCLGPGVNLGNVATADVVGLETLRLGLRADTLVDVLATDRW